MSNVSSIWGIVFVYFCLICAPVAASQPPTGWPWVSRLTTFTSPPPHTWVRRQSNQHSSHADGQPASAHNLHVLYIYPPITLITPVYTEPLSVTIPVVFSTCTVLVGTVDIPVGTAKTPNITFKSFQLWRMARKWLIVQKVYKIIFWKCKSFISGFEHRFINFKTENILRGDMIDIYLVLNTKFGTRSFIQCTYTLLWQFGEAFWLFRHLGLPRISPLQLHKLQHSDIVHCHQFNRLPWSFPKKGLSHEILIMKGSRKINWKQISFLRDFTLSF